MKAIFSFLSAVFIILTLAACCKGGGGGDATITASPYHHSKAITGSIVYVKYDATEYPGADPANYSTYFSAAASDVPVKCTGLKCGDYYLYCVGYDNAISQKVSGGLHVKIKFGDRKSNADTNIPVTE